MNNLLVARDRMLFRRVEIVNRVPMYVLENSVVPLLDGLYAPIEIEPVTLYPNIAVRILLNIGQHIHQHYLQDLL